MTVLRSILFNGAFYGWTVVMCFGWLPVLAGPRAWTVTGQRLWAAGVMFLLRHLAGISFEIRGRENLPAGACVIASKHQSIWETMIWHIIVDDPAIVMKKELLMIPIYGWYSTKAAMIPVDRRAGAKALKAMIRVANTAAQMARPLIIFPEGTRTAPDTTRPYQSGALALYRHLGLSCVPVALNSGLFWHKGSFIKQPGVIVLEFLEPIQPGFDKKEFSKLLEERIESATTRLVAEARKAAT